VSAERYVECFIAEQNLVGVAIGAACRDRTVAFVSTFAVFLTRAFDQVQTLIAHHQPEIKDRIQNFRSVWVPFLRAT
jgi:transketolase C-terminal domain/subunit